MQALPWISPTLTDFSRQLKLRRAGHAYLVGLDKGYGGEQLSLSMAQSALCLAVTERGACGLCKSCQLFSAHSHPDFYRIEADGAQIKVDQIRDLCARLTSTAQQGGRRVAVILNCERLNQASANALLKTLEEPGKDTILILQSDSQSRLMATISSRCQRLHIELPNRAEVRSWLQGFAEIDSDVTWCLPVVGGPLELVCAVNEGRYQRLLDFRKAWTQSLSSGHLCASLVNVNEKQVSDALKVLYLVLRHKLIKQKDMDALKRASLTDLAMKVTQICNRLTVMPNINALGLLQSLVLEYAELTSP